MEKPHDAGADKVNSIGIEAGIMLPALQGSSLPTYRKDGFHINALYSRKLYNNIYFNARAFYIRSSFASDRLMDELVRAGLQVYKLDTRPFYKAGVLVGAAGHVYEDSLLLFSAHVMAGYVQRNFAIREISYSYVDTAGTVYKRAQQGVTSIPCVAWDFGISAGVKLNQEWLISLNVDILLTEKLHNIPNLDDEYWHEAVEKDLLIGLATHYIF